MSSRSARDLAYNVTAWSLGIVSIDSQGNSHSSTVNKADRDGETGACTVRKSAQR